MMTEQDKSVRPGRYFMAIGLAIMLATCLTGVLGPVLHLDRGWELLLAGCAGGGLGLLMYLVLKLLGVQPPRVAQLPRHARWWLLATAGASAAMGAAMAELILHFWRLTRG
jgi:hypothetical protein